MNRSEIRVKLGAVDANVRRLRQIADGSELWAVVKGNAYGHGALDIARTSIDAGATALCVATMREGIELRKHLAAARIIVLGPAVGPDVRYLSEHSLEQVAATAEAYAAIPSDVPVHIKLNTGMNRWGFTDMPTVRSNVVGVMSQFAAAGRDEKRSREQLVLFNARRAPYPELTAHVANSAATLLFPDSHLDAVRCGATVVGLSPFGDDPGSYGLRPAMRWTSYVAQVIDVKAGDWVGYGAYYECTHATRIGIIPVGYADGFRRDMTGTSVLVGDDLCPVVGAVSMDAVAVAARKCAVGDPVILVGDGVLLEDHAQVAGTMSLEIACHIRSDATRASRIVIEGDAD